jgi:uncharacterized protein YdaU (DUF1376 family)
MQRPWMPMYWGDYFRDTRHLSRGQHGAYCLLIGHYWSTGSLPDDDRQLAQITLSTPEEWQADKPVLQAFFHDGWKHKRVDAELRRSADNYARLAAAGQKGGLTTSMNREKLRWEKQRLR